MSTLDQKLSNYLLWLEKRGLNLPLRFPPTASLTNPVLPPSYNQTQAPASTQPKILFICPKLHSKSQKDMAKNILKALKLTPTQFLWLRHEPESYEHNLSILKDSLEGLTTIVSFGVSRFSDIYSVEITDPVSKPVVKLINDQKTKLIIVPSLAQMQENPFCKKNVWLLFQKELSQA